ncbi:MetQ/NlpA family ABC transporter substrate-binding protein [Lactobacillus acetotolerans]|jgi:D-methionine transport system substrate-binding protein|uniref:Lipoprotein n=1 Tax=Lactobacillus acetotolerans TaxID=1600 RepID=A0A0D6A3P0_9LACO|nr:MetQ/NlpA family ABC transporter substrate-binding protein [Lactobacillus acetotolerans]MBN7277091.1 MetQ/NlpA family ABC transporter substrate-binding protein [Lactobacillus acetotolerans]BAQ57140.1 ABC transporter ATP-binding component [Lactobacillus acetotolerans]HCX40676.1 MetQ/NlpA family ABC transporter substrate-binding protein [Lactobacillus acetotolerans]
MRRKRRRNTIIWIIIAVLILIAAWFSFGPGINTGQQNKTVTIGVVGESKPEQVIWKSVAATAKEKYGINLQVKNFTDYNQPNKALKSGDIDLNAFQHYAFLKSWNKANHGGVVAVGKTMIAPIRLYSRKYHKLSALPNGATIAIPNDPTNESRALFVLKNAGLITLRKGKSLLTVADIMKNPNGLKFKEVSADQCGRVLSSVDAAVVNNDYSGPAGLTDKQTIYVEPINKDSEQWINIIATKKGQKNNKEYQDVVKAYQTEKTKKLYRKFYGNTQVAAWDIKLK